MTRVQKRKYEKIDEDEIDLVIRCSDSHEFYEKYREIFPTKKKGIDSISKIWKRRGEFLKKHPDASPSLSSPNPLELAEMERLLTVQNALLQDMSVLLREHLGVSREILARLPAQTPGPDHSQQHRTEPKLADHKEQVKKPATDKRGDIMIGS